MRKRPVFKKLTAYALAALLVLSLAACGAGKEPAGQTQTGSSGARTGTAAATGNSWEIDKSPVDISFYVDVQGHDFAKLWGQDDVSKKWIEDTGVNLKWESAYDSDHKKLNLYIASGELPDMILLRTDYEGRRDLAKNDAIWALDKLAEEADAPEFMKNFDENIIVNKRVDYDSMDFYAMPCFHTPEQYMDEPFITKNTRSVTVIDKLYEEAGSPQIKTGEDYVNLLKKVKEKNPNMIAAQSVRTASPDPDGGPRLVYVLLNHAGLGARYFKQDDGYVKYWEQPNFLAVLKFANQLYNEGLVDKTEFTDDKTKLVSKVEGGTVFSEISEDTDNLDKYNSYLHKVHSDENWIMIEPFSLVSGVQFEADSLDGGVGNREVVISKNSKNAVRALRFLDYICQPETQKDIIYGVEGRGHTMADGKPVVTDEYKKALEELGEQNTLYGNLNYYILRNNYWSTMNVEQQMAETTKESQAIAQKYYKDFSFYNGAENFPSDSDEIKIAAQIKEYYSKEVMKVITASPGEVESLYNNMISQMKKLGLDKLNAYYTSYFNSKQQTIDKYKSK